MAVALSDIGIPLGTLVAKESGETLTTSVHTSDEAARKRLDTLLGVLAAAAAANKGGRVKPFRFHEDDWAVVNTAKDTKHVLAVTSQTAAEQQFYQAQSHKLLTEEWDWKMVAGQGVPARFRMILRCPLSGPETGKKKR